MSYVPGLPGGGGGGGGGSGPGSLPGPFQQQTALDIITGALRRINAYAAGESLQSPDSQDALLTLNDLLDSLSTEHEAIYGSLENVLTFTPGKYIYTIGQAQGGTFVGIATQGSAVITSVVPPTGLAVNSYIADATGAFPANTYVQSIGANSITLTQQATLSTALETFSYTIPGDFCIDAATGAPVLRPLRVTNAFTRITSSSSALDYQIQIVSQDEYTRIGFKGIPAPWPIAVWYNPTMPLGTLSFYQNPSTAGTLHLFTDFLLMNFPTLATVVTMPQGYMRWLKWALAKELAPEYQKPWTASRERLWKEARENVKSLNSIPAQIAQYDSAIIKTRNKDAGWIMHGGFR
jgi:hypothetical protein